MCFFSAAFCVSASACWVLDAGSGSGSGSLASHAASQPSRHQNTAGPPPGKVLRARVGPADEAHLAVSELGMYE